MYMVDSDQIYVCKARLSDIEELCDLYLSQSREARRLFHPFPFNKTKLKLIFFVMITSDKLMRIIKRIIPTMGFALIVSYDANKSQLLGFIYYHIISKHKGRFIANVGITTREGIRTKGIGTKLYAALIERAKQVGVKKFTATILADNVASIALCKKYGYKVLGDAPDDHWEGKNEKNILVELDLEETQTQLV